MLGIHYPSNEWDELYRDPLIQSESIDCKEQSLTTAGVSQRTLTRRI